MSEAELTDYERGRLLQELNTDVPDGFADRVMDAVDRGPEAHRSAGAARVRRPGRGQDRRRVVGLAVLIAAALVLILSGVMSVVLRREAVTPSLVERRAEATQVLRARCGGCHDRRQSKVSPDALAAFDLGTDGWAANASEESLRGIVDRIGSDDDVRPGVRAFVEAELEARRG